MRRSTKRIWILTGLSAFIFASLVLASAAALPLSAFGLGAGTDDVDCQTSAVTTDWLYNYDDTLPGYRVTAVELDGLDAGCLNKNIEATLADSGGASVTSGSNLTPGSGTSVTVIFTPGFDLSLTWVSDLIVTIYE